MSIVVPPKGRKILIADGNRVAMVGSLMAMACSALPILTEPERLYPPKIYPENERHQGTKERERRLRQRREAR